MKGTFILVICILTVTACRRNAPTDAPAAAAETKADTIAAEPDTVNEEPDESVPPSTVDALFADFIYSYSSNRTFQMGRTKFPLKRYINNKEGKPVKRADWKFDKLYYKTELHTIIFDSEQAWDDFDMSKATHVVVELIKFSDKSVKQYVFLKDHGKWELTQLNYISLSQHPDAAFIEFYGHFANDSAFQRKHINEYVDFTTYDEDNDDEKIEGIIDVDQWYAFHPDLPSGNVLNIYYGQELGNTDVRVVSIRGNSNSWSSMFKFKKKTGVWKLVKFVN